MVSLLHQASLLDPDTHQLLDVSIPGCGFRSQCSLQT